MRSFPFIVAVRALISALCLGRAHGATGATTTVLYSFTGGRDGRNPVGPLIFDNAGNLYGTAQYGGVGCGVIFELSPPTQGTTWTESVLHIFNCKTNDSYPTAGLVFDQTGNLYGTTSGTAFQLSPPAAPGGSWTYTVLHKFGGADKPDGGQPNGNLILDQAGNLYGTAYSGGAFVCSIGPGPCGLVFELLRPTQLGGSWEEKVLYDFSDVPDGSYPAAGVIFDNKGNLYGNTTSGGTGPCTDGEGLTIGCGTAFELSPTSKGGWTERVLYNFRPSEDSPGNPFVFGADGSLYGTAAYDVFRLIPPIDWWVMAASTAVYIHARHQWDRSIVGSDHCWQSWSVRNHCQQRFVWFQHSIRPLLSG